MCFITILELTCKNCLPGGWRILHLNGLHAVFLTVLPFRDQVYQNSEEWIMERHQALLKSGEPTQKVSLEAAQIWTTFAHAEQP